MSTQAPKQHKLNRLSMVSWYLFESKDIYFSETSTLLSGINGVGKSSVIDGIQTVLVGADENKLMLNASGSDGKRSGRSISSYVLGEVAASPGHDAIQPRQSSNSYLCLSFNGKNGKPFCFGIGFYASQQSGREVSKHYFTLTDDDLSADDFMLDENTVMPWKQFEQQLRNRKGTAQFPSNGKEFRDVYCELLSSDSSHQHAISADMMMNAVKNGLSFGKQKDITEFTKRYILPEIKIDVNRIETDYDRYCEMETLIKEAEKKFIQLNHIVDSLEKYEKYQKKGTAFLWAKEEATCIASDIKVEACKEKLADAKDEILMAEEALSVLTKQTKALQDLRDEAHFSKKNSDEGRALEQHNARLKVIDQELSDAAVLTGQTRSQLAELLQLTMPASVAKRLTDDFTVAHKALADASEMESGDLTRQWPVDIDQIDETLSSLTNFKALREAIQAARDNALKEFDFIKQSYDDLYEVVEKASEGEASLSKETEAMIALLDQKGIEVVPVCDLAEITDPAWQYGIESFLGNNRESLVITGGSDPGVVEEAIRQYRILKKQDKRLRRVKLINPGKLKAHRAEHDTSLATSLISSDNEVAFNYICGLLNRIKLVDSEEDLRKADRAITQDGMVAANGTISGGSNIRWVLIGHQARKDNAQRLIEELTSLKPEKERAESSLSQMNALANVFGSSIDATIQNCVTVRQLFLKLDGQHSEQASLKDKIIRLENGAVGELEKTFNECDQRLKDHQTAVQKHETKKLIAQNNATKLDDAIPGLEDSCIKAAEERSAVSKRELFDATTASKMFEELEDKFAADYSVISEKAEEESTKAFGLATAKRETGKKDAAIFMERYDTDGRDQLLSGSPIFLLAYCFDYAKRIDESEVVLYRADAEKAREDMLANFRSEVVAKLKDSFARVDQTFGTLNRTLSALPFNNNIYRFKYAVVDIESIKKILEYITDTSDLEIDHVGNLFDFDGEHPAIDIIDEILKEGRLREISDYRNFYSYDIISKDMNTQTERSFAELLSVGSGGEKQTPFYVALGASFMGAYKLRRIGDQSFGGGALALFDEAFTNMDANNTKAALQFFKDIGLQVIVAGPKDVEAKIGPAVDTIISVMRSGPNMFVENRQFTDSGRELMEEDDPNAHPEVVELYMDEVKERYAE